MNKITFMIVAILFVTQLSIAQDAEVTTYFGEKCGFKIDFPAEWGVSLQEPKVMFAYNTILVGVKGDTPGAVVTLRVTYPGKSPEKDIKTWISVFEKGAKKSKDPIYKVHGQGEGKTPDGVEFSFYEYTHTLVGDDGSNTSMHRKFYITNHRFKGTVYQFAFFFETIEPDWTKFNTTYESIFNSVKYTAKEK